MNILNKKVLITGGGSGIGFCIAKVFSENGANAILVGRNEKKLKKSAAILSVAYIVADVSKPADIKRLIEIVNNEHGGVDILINNAGIVHNIPAIFTEEYVEKVREEMDINFHAVVNTINQFLPILRTKIDAAIVNVASILAYVPSLHAATYSASKAALHSYSQSLRLYLERGDKDIKVFEVFPPLTDTDMTANSDAPKLAPEVIAADLLVAMKNNIFSVRCGLTKTMYEAMLKSPENALLLLNND